MKIIAITIIFITLFSYCVWYILKSNKREWLKKENLPKELIKAKLFMSEKYISCTSPRRLCGFPDQVFAVSKDLIIVDTKSRDSNIVYKKDIVQISVYAVILRKKYKRKRVRDYGYIRIDNYRGISYKKVELLSEDEIINLYDRNEQLKKFNSTANKTNIKPLCKTCVYQKKCFPY